MLLKKIIFARQNFTSMNKIKFLLIAVAMLSASASFAQFNTPDRGTSFTLKLNGVMPTGNFGKSTALGLPSVMTYGTEGNAEFGAGLGFNVTYRFGFGLGVFLSADAMWNPIDAEMASNYNAISKTKPNYVNFPIMLGVDYQCYFGDFIGIYGEGGMGTNLMFITPEGWSGDLTHYKLSTAFAGQFGAGILLGKHISIGVHYYLLGKQSVTIKKQDKPITFVTERRDKISPNVLTFRLGIMF